MGYIKFETEKADYLFNGTFHLWSHLDPKIFVDIHALIIEENTSPYFFKFNTLDEIGLSGAHFGGKNFIKWLREANIPIYSVDVNTVTNDSPYQDTSSNQLTLIHQNLSRTKNAVLGIYYSLLNIPISSSYQQHVSNLHFKAKSITSARNAISAEKIEADLVDRINQECCIARPTIGLVYGIDHAGIIDDLKSKERRQQTIKHYQQQNFNGLKLDQINEIRQIHRYPDQPFWVNRKIHTSINL